MILVKEAFSTLILMHFKRLLVLLLILYSYIGLSQKPDSTLLLSSTQNEELVGLTQSSQKTDTILDNTHNYYQTGVLGNMGLPSYSLIAQDNNASSDFFIWTRLNNSNDMFTDKQALYFRPSGKIYTKITAAMGQKQEQLFKVQHSQNIKRVNISVLFNRYSCLGFYQNQKAITDNLLISSNYATKNNRWGYNSYFLFNKNKYQLNGGITSDNVLLANQGLDKLIFPVNLTSSPTPRQNIRTLSFFFSTFFRLNKRDSSKISHYFVYEGKYQSNYWLNNALADTAYYHNFNNYYYSATGLPMTDSLSMKGFSNSLLYRVNVAGNKFVIYGGYKNEFNHYTQTNVNFGQSVDTNSVKHLPQNIDTVSVNHIARAGFSLNVKNNLLTANAQYVVSGYNAANYMADAHYLLSLGKNFYFDVKVNAYSQMAAMSLQHYFSPHFIWNNTFSPIITQNGAVSFGSKKYKFSVGGFVQQQQNSVYLDTMALPAQYHDVAINSRVFVQKDLRLWHIHLNNIVNLQPGTSVNFIRLPQFVTLSQLYYEAKLFKKNLWLQTGVQARYISSFEANIYMPATNQFYLQGKTVNDFKQEKNYGEYVFIDIFLNAQIDRFRFFLMASHINQKIMGGNYLLAPNYPMPDRSFKAGLVWMFFD
jgi:hypothetical protein